MFGRTMKQKSLWIIKIVYKRKFSAKMGIFHSVKREKKLVLQGELDENKHLFHKVNEKG